MRVRGFNHVAINVSDLDRALRFYRDVLGMDLVRQGERSAHLDWGGAWVCLISRSGAKDLRGKAGVDHVAFSIGERDFDAAVDALREGGVRIVREPVVRGGGRSVNFLDPDGTQLELHTGDLAGRMEAW